VLLALLGHQYGPNPVASSIVQLVPGLHCVLILFLLDIAIYLLPFKIFMYGTRLAANLEEVDAHGDSLEVLNDEISLLVRRLDVNVVPSKTVLSNKLLYGL